MKNFLFTFRYRKKTMKTPLFLFPGLACTERLFFPQRDGLADILEIIVPEWIEPEPREPLDEFALRWAQSVWEKYFAENPEFARDGCFVGGLSFGGMVSPTIGRFLSEKGVRVLGCLRLATFRCGDEIPERFRLIWHAMNFLPNGGWFSVKIFCRLAMILFGKVMSRARFETYQQVLDSPARRCIRVVRMLYTWRGAEKPADFPILQIHGTRDRLLPIRFTHPDIRIPNANHCLTLTHPELVNEKIREFYTASRINFQK